MRPFVPAVLVVSVLFACKMFKKEEPAPSAAPAAEAPPTAAATETAAPAAEPSATTAPTSSTTVTPTKKSDAGAKDGGGADASAAGDAGSKSDAGGGKSAACAAKCQGVLQACLMPSASEGGLPKLADPQKCQAAFDECAKACK